MIGTFIAPRLVYCDQCFTSGDVMATMYGELGRILAGVASLVFSFVIIGSQIQCMSLLAHYFFGIKEYYAVILFGGIVVIYSALGGMRAVSYTDVFQLFIVFLSITWVLQVVLKGTVNFFF